MKIVQLAYFYQSRLVQNFATSKPSTDLQRIEILPKCQNFAKSGHTDRDPPKDLFPNI